MNGAGQALVSRRIVDRRAFGADTLAQTQRPQHAADFFDVDDIDINHLVVGKGGLAGRFQRGDGFGMPGDEARPAAIPPIGREASSQTEMPSDRRFAVRTLSTMSVPQFVFLSVRFRGPQRSGLGSRLPATSGSDSSKFAPATASPMITMTGPVSSSRYCRSGRSLQRAMQQLAIARGWRFRRPRPSFQPEALPASAVRRPRPRPCGPYRRQSSRRRWQGLPSRAGRRRSGRGRS